MLYIQYTFAPKLTTIIVSESGVDKPESQHTEELHHPTIINTPTAVAQQQLEQLAKDSQAATEDLPTDDGENSHDHLAKASQTDPLVESNSNSRAATAATNKAVKAAVTESKQHSSCHQSSPVHQYRYIYFDNSDTLRFNKSNGFMENFF